MSGIDCQQTKSMVRLCAETEPVLYGPHFSPTKLRYRRGARPELERIAAQLVGGTARRRAESAMQWVARNVTHPHLLGHLRPDRALDEEQLVASGCGWCNEQARVFIGLCQVLEIPARLCFLFHANARCGHTAAEVYLDNRWAFFDVTFDLTVELPGGQLAEGRELSGRYRELAHRAYRPILEEHYRRIQPFVEETPGWRREDRPTVEHGGDLLHSLGLCNYVIDGVDTL